MPFDLKAARRHCDQAWTDSAQWRAQLDELYRYALPLRRPSGGLADRGGATVSKGEPRHQHAFDLTAPRCATRFVGRISRDVTPVFQRQVDLKIGPAAMAVLRQIAPDKDDLDELVKQHTQMLEDVVEKGHGLLQSSHFGLAASESYFDLFAGQAVLLWLEDEKEIIKWACAPVQEVALRDNGMGEVVGQYWRKQWQVGDILAEWPDGVFSEKLRERMTKEPESKVILVQACEKDAKTGRWVYVCWQDDDRESGPIKLAEDLLTSRFITPRFYKVPGEAMGYGPGLIALPTIKTANKVLELTLKAAAFAILGLWIYRNDRSFNPNTARMAPGQFWAVPSTGGPMGPAVQKLDVPGRFDISNIILQELRQMIRETCFDDALPLSTAAVKSATEIVERIKQLYADLSGAYERLVLELIVPLWRGLIDVMYRRHLIETPVPLDQLIYAIEIVSPIARTQQAQDVSALTDWLQILLSTVGVEGAALTAKIEDIGAEIGRKLGVPERLIRSAGERKGVLELVAKLIVSAQAQGQPPAPGAAPAPAQPQPLAA